MDVLESGENSLDEKMPTSHPINLDPVNVLMQ